jgi:D-alanyl-lipoteichoic acid acyltransferase DltB (MBOAT superfamily)
MIYCDFSGYVDMARGLGLLMGFYLPDNFNMPYKAANIAEFWRRWHITFSNWLRDYVYLPLGGSRKSKPRVYLNLFITLFVAGVWHGATWGYILWGVVHGVGLVAYKMLQDVRRARGINPKTLVHPLWWVVVAWLLTLHLNVFARIFFYTSDLATAFAYLGGLSKLTVLGKGVEWLILPVIALGFAMNFWGDRVRAAFIRMHDQAPWLARPAIWIAIGVGILALQPDDVAPFIYFMF